MRRVRSRIKNQGFPVREEWILWGLLLVTGITWGVTLDSLGARLTCPFQVNQGEAINVEFARMVLRGQALYPDPLKGPYLYFAYPPLFPWIQAFFLKLGDGIWQAGRFLAFFGYLGCAALMGVWGLKRWGRPRGLGMAFLFLLSPTWRFWGTMVRSDTFLLFLHFASFLILLDVEMKETPSSRGRILAAGFLAGAACLVKQSAVSLLLVYFLYSVLKRHWSRLFLFLSAALIPWGLVTGILEYQTQGFYLKYTHEWLGIAYRPELFWGFIRGSFLPEMGWLWIAGAAVLVVGHPLLRLQWIVSVLWLGALGRMTSAENYMLEFVLYGFLAFGEGGIYLKKAGRFMVPALLATGLVCFAFRPALRIPDQNERSMKRAVLPIYEKEGEHLALDLDLPLMAGKKLWVQPLEYTSMVETGKWSSQALIRDIRDRKFSTVELYDIPEQYLLPPDVVRAIDIHYEVFLRAYGRKWLKPRRVSSS